MINKKTVSSPLSAYCGIINNKNKISACFLIKDNFEYLSFELKNENDRKKIPARLSKIAKNKNLKIVAASLAGFNDFETLGTSMWLKHDIVPIYYNKEFKKTKKDLKKVAIFVKNHFNEKDMPKIFLGKDGDIKAQFLTDLKSYKKNTNGKNWKILLETAKECKEQKLKIAFINSTATGGGVALMRHALIRLSSLLKVDVSWHVMTPNSEIFNITKKKFHNVLHGVASYDIMLDDNDKKIYNEWIKKNFQLLKNSLLKKDVIIVDDPQPSGLISLLKKHKPNIKIIYRSHIQIYSKSIDEKSPQSINTWNFIWRNVRLADLFVAHPVENFVPKCVNKEKLIYMPASTDPLDGLNKKLTKKQKKYYINIFNDILASSGNEPLDAKRPYIIQVARFDPSKGIPDVIESYRKLRKKLLKMEITPSQMPQLLIIGNGAVDDPEGVPILEETRRTIEMDSYKKFAHDIKVARLPHYDQLLNTLLDDSLIALQLSHKEGFEVKVTEALMKGKPVIAYKTGGIPLQISNGKTGYLIKKSKTTNVANKLLELFTNKDFYREMSNSAKQNINPDYLTVNQLCKWLFLSLYLMNVKKENYGNNNIEQLIKKYSQELNLKLKIQ